MGHPRALQSIMPPNPNAAADTQICEPIPALDARRITALLPAALQPRLQRVDRIDSTQRALLEGAPQRPDRTFLVADYQSAGRGRRGRSWITAPGSALALSMLAHNPPGARWHPGLTLALGVATADVLHGIGARAVRLKWPNDLVVAGCKLGGILVETYAGGVVAGVGINLVLPPAARQTIGQPCLDLAALGCAVEREALVAALATAWNDAFDQFASNGLAAFQARWASLDALAGGAVRVAVGEGEPVEGIACGIDASGRLQVEVAGRRQCYASADVSVRTA